MKLVSLDTPDLIDVVACWLGKEENYKWLDFGGGVQAVTPAALRIMTQRDIHVLRVYTAETETGEVPAGVVGLSNVDRTFRTAGVWAVLGAKRHGGCTTRAVDMLVTFGFATLGLRAINAWTVDVNVAARRVLERVGFSYVGRQRQCHWIDGRPHDRLLFNLLATEHQEAGRADYTTTRLTARPVTGPAAYRRSR